MDSRGTILPVWVTPLIFVCLLLEVLYTPWALILLCDVTQVTWRLGYT